MRQSSVRKVKELESVAVSITFLQFLPGWTNTKISLKILILMSEIKRLKGIRIIASTLRKKS
jgi:hypothetical protein